VQLSPAKVSTATSAIKTTIAISGARLRLAAGAPERSSSASRLSPLLCNFRVRRRKWRPVRYRFVRARALQTSLPLLPTSPAGPSALPSPGLPQQPLQIRQTLATRSALSAPARSEPPHWRPWQLPKPKTLSGALSPKERSGAASKVLKSRASSNPPRPRRVQAGARLLFPNCQKPQTARRADGGTGVRCGATTCDERQRRRDPPRNRSRESVVLETASGRLSAGEQVSQWQAPPPMAC